MRGHALEPVGYRDARESHARRSRPDRRGDERLELLFAKRSPPSLRTGTRRQGGPGRARVALGGQGDLPRPAGQSSFRDARNPRESSTAGDSGRANDAGAVDVLGQARCFWRAVMSPCSWAQRLLRRCDSPTSRSQPASISRMATPRRRTSTWWRPWAAAWPCWTTTTTIAWTCSSPTARRSTTRCRRANCPTSPTRSSGTASITRTRMARLPT